MLITAYAKIVLDGLIFYIFLYNASLRLI